MSGNGYNTGAPTGNAFSAAYGGSSPTASGLQAKSGGTPSMPGGTPGPTGYGPMPMGLQTGMGGPMGLQTGQGFGMGLQNGFPGWGSPFSYSPNAGPIQPRPIWDNGGWNTAPPPPGQPPAPPPGTPPPAAGGPPTPPYNNPPPPGSFVRPPVFGPGPPRGDPQPPGDGRGVGPGSGGGGGLPPPPPAVGGRPGLGTNPKMGLATGDPAAGSNDALMQAVLTGQGGGAFTPGQLNQYGPPAGGGSNWGQTLNYYQQNQARLNRQGPMYQPGGMFYNPAIDGA